MIVGFEGLNGVGKSTMAKKFAKEFGYKYISRPIYNVFGADDNYLGVEYKVATQVEDKIYNKKNNYELKACLTGLGLLYVHKVMNNENLVIDRDLLSNFSYNGTNESLPLFEAFFKMGVYPDITFLLYASKDEIIKRIIKRNPNDSDLTDEDVVNQSYEKILKFVNLYEIPAIIIDTTEKSEEQVFEEIKMKYLEVVEKNGNFKSSG